MRYLGLALFAEGSTDYRLLGRILYRTVEDVCLLCANDVIEIGGIRELDAPKAYRDSSRATRILEAARQDIGAFHILFIHADANGDAGRARQKRVEPAVQLIRREEELSNTRGVAVVPVRETEAWALADGDALRGAFGTTLDDEGLGIPARPQEVERLTEPKQALDHALREAVGGSRRRRHQVTTYLNAIGERVGLARLRAVPAYRRFESDLRAALRQLGYIH